jgi:CarboxypepD_reg-like domain
LKKLLFLVLCLCFGLSVFAQGGKKVVQLSGLVVAGEFSIGIPHVALYLPKGGRGVTTNEYGYFSVPCLQGDSIVISAMGFQRQYYKVPVDDRQSISVIIYLKEDPYELPTVEVMPYPTEELFKEAFLALKLPEEDQNQMRKNLDPRVMDKLRFEMPMDGSMNHTYFLQQQVAKIESRNLSPTTTQLTNPFAWASFIQSVRRGDLKKKKYKDQ